MACATEIPLLHGGITALPNRNQALSEASLVGHNLSKQPERYARRWNYDAANQTRLWQRLRRVYWLTLLGSELVQQAGGPAAARAAGAANARDVGGSLMIWATEHPEDALHPEFSKRTHKLTKWLWPYLIQNPEDDR
jgi:hypothetical protein